MTGEAEDDIPDSGAVFTFGKSKFAGNIPSKFWLKNDIPLKIACGDEHTALITENGKLFMFGSNNWGQLGLGSKTSVTKPTCVKALKTEKVDLVACGRNHTIVCTSRGIVYTCGGNSEGQLGLGDYEERTAFQRVNFFCTHGPIKMLAAGSNTSAALTESGKLFMWGDNTEGQLGLGEESSATTPREVTVDQAVSWVSCGYYHSAFVTVDGGLYTFGECDSGKLGLATEQLANHNVAQLVKGIKEPVTQVACGGGHTVALTEEDVYTFGLGQYGQLGHGTFIFETPFPRVVEHFRRGRVKHIMCGENHTAVVTDSGLLYTFGDGRHGKLGLGEENFTNQFKPTLCPRFLKFEVKAVTCGGCHMMVLARSRDEDCEEAILEEDDVTEDRLGKPDTDLLGDTTTSLNRSLSARVRRRERESSSEQFGLMFHTLPPIPSSYLNAPVAVSSQTMPPRLLPISTPPMPPPTQQANRKGHNGIQQLGSTGSHQKEQSGDEQSKDDQSCTVENLSDNDDSVKDLGDTTDFLNMTLRHPGENTLTTSPVQKRKGKPASRPGGAGEERERETLQSKQTELSGETHALAPAPSLKQASQPSSRQTLPMGLQGPSACCFLAQTPRPFAHRNRGKRNFIVAATEGGIDKPSALDVREIGSMAGPKPRPDRRIRKEGKGMERNPASNSKHRRTPTVAKGQGPKEVKRAMAEDDFESAEAEGHSELFETEPPSKVNSQPGVARSQVRVGKHGKSQTAALTGSKDDRNTELAPKPNRRQPDRMTSLVSDTELEAPLSEIARFSRQTLKVIQGPDNPRPSGHELFESEVSDLVKRTAAASISIIPALAQIAHFETDKINPELTSAKQTREESCSRAGSSDEEKEQGMRRRRRRRGGGGNESSGETDSKGRVGVEDESEEVFDGIVEENSPEDETLQREEEGGISEGERSEEETTVEAEERGEREGNHREEQEGSEEEDEEEQSKAEEESYEEERRVPLESEMGKKKAEYKEKEKLDKEVEEEREDSRIEEHEKDEYELGNGTQDEDEEEGSEEEENKGEETVEGEVDEGEEETGESGEREEGEAEEEQEEWEEQEEAEEKKDEKEIVRTVKEEDEEDFEEEEEEVESAQESDEEEVDRNETKIAVKVRKRGTEVEREVNRSLKYVVSTAWPIAKHKREPAGKAQSAKKAKDTQHFWEDVLPQYLNLK